VRKKVQKKVITTDRIEDDKIKLLLQKNEMKLRCYKRVQQRRRWKRGKEDERAIQMRIIVAVITLQGTRAERNKIQKGQKVYC
jgi:hypothetical protein